MFTSLPGSPWELLPALPAVLRCGPLEQVTSQQKPARLSGRELVWDQLRHQLRLHHLRLSWGEMSNRRRGASAGSQQLPAHSLAPAAPGIAELSISAAATQSSGGTVTGCAGGGITGQK